MFNAFDAGGAGDMFVGSRSGRRSRTRPAAASRGPGPVDVGMLTKAATTPSGEGAGAVPVPQVVPGIVPTSFQPLGIATSSSE